MSTFFKHVELHKYDITERDLLRACVDELVASGYDILSEEELNLLARHKLEKFKDYMRPLFAQSLQSAVICTTPDIWG